MSGEDQFQRILGRMHQAGLGDVPWSVPSSMIHEFIATKGTALVVGEGWSQADVQLLFAQFCHGQERRADLERMYFKDYYHRDEIIPRLLRLPAGQVVPTERIYTDREKKTSPVYNEARRHGDMQGGIQVLLDGPDGVNILWNLGDSAESGGWSSSQVEAARRFLPHVRQFVTVRKALTEAGALGSSLARMLDNRRASVIQLDRRARIVAMNDRARALLQQGDGLSDHGGFLNAQMSRDNDTLHRLLARALPSFRTQPSAGSMTIGRHRGSTRLVVHVTPVAQREWDVRTQLVAALVLVVDPESRPRIQVGLVAEALNLTPAESRLATMVAAGRTVREVAEMTGRTEGTVRWHLKQIFRKQGISRQTDLVRRVLSLEGFPQPRDP